MTTDLDVLKKMLEQVLLNQIEIMYSLFPNLQTEQKILNRTAIRQTCDLIQEIDR